MKHSVIAVLIGSLLGYGAFELMAYGLVCESVIWGTYSVILTVVLLVLLRGSNDEN